MPSGQAAASPRRLQPLPTHATPCPLQVLIGSRRQPDGADPGSLPGLDGADVVSIGDALAGAGIVVLALPAWAHAQFAKEHGWVWV